MQFALELVRQAEETILKLITDVQNHDGEPEAADVLKTLQSTALQTQGIAELLEHELNR